MRFLTHVPCRTNDERRSAKLRAARVSASGIHASGRKPQRSSCASMQASTLSLLCLLSAIAFVFSGLLTTILAQPGLSMSTTAQVLVVASSATVQSPPR